MEHVAIPVPDDRRIFRLAYASRSTADMAHPAVVALADDAAAHNRRNHVSGVLFAENSLLLQWLEGPAEDVCALMSRISTDPRHKDVAVLSAGWLSARRYPAWPMQLADGGLARDAARSHEGKSPYDTDHAMAAFDSAAQSYRRHLHNDGSSPFWTPEFARQLIRCDSAHLPPLPGPANDNLRTRARLVDEVCETFAQAWRDDVWSLAQIAIGMAHLNCLWQRAGRAPEPFQSRHSAVVVVPPGSGEILGAIVTADLLRATGTTVHMVLEPDTEASVAALSRSACEPIIVAGPRLGLSGDAERASAFAERVQALFPGRAVHVGGCASGPLSECPERFGFSRDLTGAMPARDVEWLALTALAALTKSSRVPPRRRIGREGRFLN